MTTFVSKSMLDDVPGQNLLINGGFDIWQRGTSQTNNGYGSADRWNCTHTGGTTKTHSRQAFTPGQTDVPGEPQYFSRTAVTTGSGAADICLIRQHIEDVRILAGQTCTVSFYAKADAAKDVVVEFVQQFGTGGSPSASVYTFGATLSLTTSWQKFIVTVDIPSISGKTIGTNEDSSLHFYIWFDAGSDFDARTNSLGNQSGTFDIAQVKLEEGSKATPFVARPIPQELALCKRYYRKNPPLQGTMNEANTNCSFAANGCTEMRAAPTMSIVSATNALYRPGVDFYDISTASYNSAGYITITPSTLAGAEKPMQVLANKLAFDAEL